MLQAPRMGAAPDGAKAPQHAAPKAAVAKQSNRAAPEKEDPAADAVASGTPPPPLLVPNISIRDPESRERSTADGGPGLQLPASSRRLSSLMSMLSSSPLSKGRVQRLEEIYAAQEQEKQERNQRRRKRSMMRKRVAEREARRESQRKVSWP